MYTHSTVVKHVIRLPLILESFPTNTRVYDHYFFGIHHKSYPNRSLPFFHFFSLLLLKDSYSSWEFSRRTPVRVTE